MSELRVPTVPLDVEILYADEMHLLGRVFLPALAHRHEGPTRPDEWLNDAVPFFPFVEPTREGAILLNKDRVIVLTVPMHTMTETLPQEHIRVAKVRIECSKRWFDGTLQIDMPEGKTRVFDYLSRPDRFVPLYDDEKNECHLIRKIFIDRVVEMREE